MQYDDVERLDNFYTTPTHPLKFFRQKAVSLKINTVENERHLRSTSGLATDVKNSSVYK